MGNIVVFYLQVLLIRKALKKRNIALKDVMVERVQGVQGKILMDLDYEYFIYKCFS